MKCFAHLGKVANKEVDKGRYGATFGALCLIINNFKD